MVRDIFIARVNIDGIRFYPIIRHTRHGTFCREIRIFDCRDIRFSIVRATLALIIVQSPVPTAQGGKCTDSGNPVILGTLCLRRIIGIRPIHRLRDHIMLRFVVSVNFLRPIALDHVCHIHISFCRNVAGRRLVFHLIGRNDQRMLRRNRRRFFLLFRFPLSLGTNGFLFPLGVGMTDLNRCHFPVCRCPLRLQKRHRLFFPCLPHIRHIRMSAEQQGQDGRREPNFPIHYASSFARASALAASSALTRSSAFCTSAAADSFADFSTSSLDVISTLTPSAVVPVPFVSSKGCVNL